MTISAVFGGEAVLRGVKSDGKTLTAFCDIEGAGDVTNKAEILDALFYLDGSLTEKNAQFTTVEKSRKLTIEVPAFIEAFTMTSTENKEFSIVDGKIHGKCVRTYTFTFAQEQRGVPIAPADMRNFILNAVKTDDKGELYITKANIRENRLETTVTLMRED